VPAWQFRDSLKFFLFRGFFLRWSHGRKKQKQNNKHIVPLISPQELSI